jgi:hypothetical protein
MQRTQQFKMLLKRSTCDYPEDAIFGEAVAACLHAFVNR